MAAAPTETPPAHAPGSSVPCAHCGAPTPSVSTGLPFCCAGCARVHALLGELGLGEFYRLRDSVAAGVGEPAPLEPGEGLAAFAGEAFRREHVRELGDGRCRVRWSVPGLHCAACIWILEQLPRLSAGVQQARADLGEGSLAVTYDAEATDPTRIAAAIQRLGYRVHAAGDDARERGERLERRAWLLRVAVAFASAMSAMHLGTSLLVGEGELALAELRFFGIGALLVAAPAIVWSAAPIWRAAWANVRAGRFEIDVSTAAVLIIGVIASLHGVIAGTATSYADALAMFVCLLLGARMLLLFTRHALARRWRGAGGILPPTARRRRGDGEERIASASIRPGDRILVAASEIVPCDGRLLSPARLDQSVLTGESRPRRAEPGDEAWAGCIAVDDLELEAHAAGPATRIGRMLAEVRAASSRPTASLRIADRIQAWFTPATLILAAVAWWLWQDAGRGLDQAIAVILVACPCAIGLAAPLAYTLAMQAAAGRGLLLRDGAVLEDLARLRHLVLDKTGTCTEGRARLTAWDWLEADPQRRARGGGALRWCEERARHPLAPLIAGHLAELGCEPVPCRDWREEPGLGLSGVLLDGGELCLRKGGNGGLIVTLDQQPLLQLSVEDPLRAGLATAIERWRQAGSELHLASGDAQAPVTAVALALNISDARADCLPEDKRDLVRQLQGRGPVAVVGDGVNDCLALAAADVGIAVRGGLETALASGDIYLLRDTASGLSDLLELALRSRRVLIQTLAWAVVYNLVAIALVLAGFWGPLICAIAMPASSLAVTAMLIWAFRERASGPIGPDLRKSPPIQPKNGSSAPSSALPPPHLHE